MDITILPNGRLQLSIEPSEREDLIDANERGGEIGALCDLTEPYWTNGGFQPFDAGQANPYVGITSAPCIAETLESDEDGRYTIVGRAWWLDGYEMRGAVDELLKNGITTFAAIPGYGLDEKEELIQTAQQSPAQPAPAARRPGV